MTEKLRVLGESVRHLRDVTSSIGSDDYTASAYPSEWSIADTLSHLGSGAVIGERRFDDSLNHRDDDPAFNTSVWDEWNAKEPAAQVRDCLASDQSFLSSLEAATATQRKEFTMAMGPFTFDFDGLVGLRLGEHVLHTWDVEVARDPQATLANDAANTILDGIQFIASRTGKPTGATRSVPLRTNEPLRDFTLVLTADTVDLVEERREGAVELELDAESLVRLIYGRLDDDHTPDSLSGDVSFLRTVFPGF